MHCETQKVQHIRWRDKTAETKKLRTPRGELIIKTTDQHCTPTHTPPLRLPFSFEKRGMSSACGPREQEQTEESVWQD